MPIRALFVALALALAAPAGALAADPILPLAQVSAGMRCTARTVVAGTSITSFDAAVLDVVAPRAGEGSRILVRVSGPAVEGTGVAEGFSGSPLICPGPGGEPRIAGAVSEGIGAYGNALALATPIEAMLHESVRPPASASRDDRMLAAARPLRAPLTISGLSDPVRRALALAARRLGVPVVAAPAAPLGAPAFPPQALVPGASVAAGYAVGDLSAGAVGTVSYRDGTRVWAFGHALDGAGRRSLYLQDAYVYAVVPSPLADDAATSYKLAAPGHVLGTLSADAPDAVAGILGAQPRTVRMAVGVRDLDNGRRTALRARSPDETDVGDPVGSSPPTFVAPLLATQAITQAYDGAPADESGRVCVRLRVRELGRALGFCSRYVIPGSISETGAAPLSAPVSSVVGEALSLVDDAEFARLHTTSVDIGVEIARGLRLARIASVAGPRTARRGQTIALRVRARARRGPMVSVALRLRVPRDLARGAHRVVLSGRGVDEEDSDPVAALAAALGGKGGEPSVPAARSPRELVRQISGLGRRDGPRAAFSGRRGRVAVPADARWRLSGRGTLRLVVR